MWEFYLSEAAFRWQDLVVFQIQLTRNNYTMPTNRDDIARSEKQLELRAMAL